MSANDLKETRVIFDREVYLKIMHWVHKSTDEVSGLGTVVPLEDGSFKIASAMMLPQKNTGSSTDIEAADVAKAMYETREAPGTLNFWWHSHVNMNTFWSTTDTDTMQVFGGGADGGFCISTVFNKKNEYRTAYYQKLPSGAKLFFDELETQVITFVDKTLTERWDAEYDKNVQKKTWESNYKGWQGPDKVGKYDEDVGGFITWGEKLRGFSRLRHKSGDMRKFPINRLGIVLGHGLKDDVKPPPFVLDRIVKSNSMLQKIKFTPKEIESRNEALQWLTEAELETAWELMILTEEEFDTELKRRVLEPKLITGTVEERQTNWID